MVGEDQLEADDEVSDTEEFECRLPRTVTAPQMALRNHYWWKDQEGQWRLQEGHWNPIPEWDKWRKAGESLQSDGTYKPRWRKVRIYEWKGWVDFHGAPYPANKPGYNDDCLACRERRLKDEHNKRQHDSTRMDADAAMESLANSIKKLHTGSPQQ